MALAVAVVDEIVDDTEGKERKEDPDSPPIITAKVPSKMEDPKTELAVSSKIIIIILRNDNRSKWMEMI